MRTYFNLSLRYVRDFYMPEFIRDSTKKKKEEFSISISRKKYANTQIRYEVEKLEISESLDT